MSNIVHMWNCWREVTHTFRLCWLLVICFLSISVPLWLLKKGSCTSFERAFEGYDRTAADNPFLNRCEPTQRLRNWRFFLQTCRFELQGNGCILLEVVAPYLANRLCICIFLIPDLCLSDCKLWSLLCEFCLFWWKCVCGAGWYGHVSDARVTKWLFHINGSQNLLCTKTTVNCKML